MKKIILISIMLCGLEANSKFIDKIEGSGVDFVHVNGMNGNYYLPEIMGGGAAFFDYDNDGDMDVYIVQSGNLPNDKNINLAHGDKLYRNDTKSSDQPIFVDVTKQAGIVLTATEWALRQLTLTTMGTQIYLWPIWKLIKY